jgi:hypothetical protein
VFTVWLNENECTIPVRPCCVTLADMAGSLNIWLKKNVLNKIASEKTYKITLTLPYQISDQLLFNQIVANHSFTSLNIIIISAVAPPKIITYSKI